MAGSSKVRACAECHKDPHQGSYGATCTSCHGTGTWKDAATRFKHISAFPLAGGHAGVKCSACHEASGAHSVVSLSGKSLPVRGCIACHASPHRREVLTSIALWKHVPENETCTECHSADGRSFLFPVAKMTRTTHNSTGFLLERPHDKVDCAGCHKDIGMRKPLAAGPQLAQQFAAIYPGRKVEECKKCHTDPHAGQFNAGASRGSCTACHSATAFLPSNFDLKQHETTGFALTGAHRAIACGECHKKKDGVVQYVSTPSACVSCHADVHKGKFDRKPKDSIPVVAQGCARCHSTETFAKVNWTADDHNTWTAYPLGPMHAKVACTDCHKPVAADQGSTWGAAATTCAACHADPHLGQFARGIVTDCARCHTDNDKFKVVKFDHQKDSAFKLDQTHAKVACTGCHRPVQVSSTVKVIRYRPLGTNCEDCHTSRPGGVKESR